MDIQIRMIPLTSLEKVFLDTEPEAVIIQAGNGVFKAGSILKNEKFSFQVAFNMTGVNANTAEGKLSIDSPISRHINPRLVGSLPSVTTSYRPADDYYLRLSPGLFPDPLFDISDGNVKFLPGKWQSIWFTVKCPGNTKPGSYPIAITLASPQKNVSNSVTVELEIMNVSLPEQKLIYTNWLHCDCIASMHKCRIFSEKHWHLVEKYVKAASDNGMNMVLTPAFTPPLDTPQGGERATAQLVGINKNGDSYTFDFRLLGRWIDMCLKNGIKYFEHTQLFSQWGAEHAPKIMAWEEGAYRRIFGWETDATGPLYSGFLRQYIPALLDFLKSKGVDRKTFFHISDEPSLKHIGSYTAAHEIIAGMLDGYELFDALSEYEYYEKGLVTAPVVTIRKIENFTGKVENLWAYYTGYTVPSMSNRFFSMPSARNRILGTQLYKFKVKGFLQWAFNFYYTTLSKEDCNPFISTDAYGEFPSGTAYMVYPGENGPVESLRLLVFNEGLQDMRAMQLLESLAGRDAVMAIIDDPAYADEYSEKDENGIYKGISFFRYPHGSKYIMSIRERINRKIKECCSKL